MNPIMEVERKEEMTKIGIASYRINDMTESESIQSLIRQEMSYTYAAVRCPYSKSKYPTWRIFQLDPKKPMIPMGYYGQPSIAFDCLDGEAVDHFIKIAKKCANDNGKMLKWKKLDDDRVTLQFIAKEEVLKGGN